MNPGFQIGTAVDTEAQLALLSRSPSADVRAQLCIGGISIQIAGSRRTDVTFDHEHEPFRVTPGRADIEIDVLWVEDVAPTRGRVVFDSGTTWRLYQREGAAQFDFLALGLPYKRLFVDSRFHRATVEMSAGHFRAFPHLADPLAYPLDELLIMHRLTQEKAIELHGCGIVRADGTGNLFVGHSGAGKSTTTRLWTAREDVEVLSDDRIIVRRDHKKQVPHRRCAPVRNDNQNCWNDKEQKQVLRLRDRSASSNVHSAQDDKKNGIRMYGTPWHGEAMYASPNSAPLARIFVLEHGHGNVITRLSPSQAVAELFARAFVPFHRHEYVESALTFLEEVVEEIPVYRYAFEPNEAAVEVVAGFRD
jgi:hypothetical protein